MAHERRRAALAALCVFAIALAATLFPASGFGSQPAGVGADGNPNGPTGGEIGPDPASTSNPDAQTTTSEISATSTTSTGSSEDPDDTTEETPTTTVNETASDSTGSDDDRQGLFKAIILVAFGLVSLLGVVGFWTGVLTVSVTAASGPLPFTIAVRGTPIGELAGSIPTRTMALVVGLSASVPRLLDDAATLSREVGQSFGTLLGGLARGSTEALRIGVQGLSVTVAAIPRALAGLGAGVGLLESIGNVGLPSLDRGGGDERRNRRGRSRVGSDDPEETEPPSVEEAWTTLRDRIPMRNRDARTPGEVARAAAQRGYPDEAVRKITDAFREVRYGDLPRDDRTDSARSALDRLREHWRGKK